MNHRLFFLALIFFTHLIVYAQTDEDKIKHISIGTSSRPEQADVKLMLIHRIQSYKTKTGNVHDNYDRTIASPKSVIILNSKQKLYVHSLEGSTTSVYDLNTFKCLRVISHRFSLKDSALFFGLTTYFNVVYRTKKQAVNVFQGKPVESCLTHDGKYLWVTYYRRDYDKNAVDPSALAIIDTDTDQIVRVIPTGPLPKMIAASPDNRYVAVTHWGDNTVGLIDISSNDYRSFSYIKNVVIGYKKSLNYSTNEKINRDKNCGFCLRGTVFSPDSLYLLVGKMGGDGIAVIDLATQKYRGTIQGMKNNIRHILIHHDTVYLSINKEGYVQSASYSQMMNFYNSTQGRKPYTQWRSAYTEQGCRTICISPDGRYVFAAVNNKSKIAVIRTKDMSVVSSVDADSFPVGMAIDESGTRLIVTSQGKSHGGGNSVMVFSIEYNS